MITIDGIKYRVVRQRVLAPKLENRASTKYPVFKTIHVLEPVESE